MMRYIYLTIGFLITSVFTLQMVHCTFDMFIDNKEVYRLLGVKAEIYYVRNGTVHHNALNHVFTLPSDLNVDYFTWESFDAPIPFSYEVKISDEKVAPSVSVNVSNPGTIPVARETVRTDIVCSGLLRAEVEIEFNFNLTVRNSVNNLTEISFRRKKLCHGDMQKNTIEIDQQPIAIDGFDSSQLKVFYVVLCLGCSLFTLLIVCFLAYIVSNKKDSRRDPIQDEQQIRLRSTMTQNAPYVLNTLGVHSGTSTSSNMSHASNRRNATYTQLDNRSLDLHDKITDLAIERKRIRLQKIELEGTFGRVFNGTYTKEDGSEEGVLVKTVMDFACPTQVQLLLKEGLSLYGLKQRNIMSVMGVSIEEHAEPFVMYLREGYTNLKKFLQKCKLSPEGIAHTLTTQEVVEMALQIIAGIQYMHKKKFLHKDLAARNCLPRISFVQYWSLRGKRIRQYSCVFHKMMNIACSSVIPPKIINANTSIVLTSSENKCSNDDRTSSFKEVRSKLRKLRKMFSTTIFDLGRKHISRDLTHPSGEEQPRSEVLGITASRQKKGAPGSSKSFGSKFNVFKKKSVKQGDPSTSSTNATENVESAEKTEEEAPELESSAAKNRSKASPSSAKEQAVDKKKMSKSSLSSQKTKEEKHDSPLNVSKSKEQKSEKQVTQKDFPAANEKDDKLCSAPNLLLHDIIRGKESRICSRASLQDLLQPVPDSLKLRETNFNSDAKFQVIIPLSDGPPLELENSIFRKSFSASFLPQNEQNSIKKQNLFKVFASELDKELTKELISAKKITTKSHADVMKKNSKLVSSTDDVTDKRQKKLSKDKIDPYRITTEQITSTPFSNAPTTETSFRAASVKSKSKRMRKPFAKPLKFRKSDRDGDAVDESEDGSEMNKTWKKQRSAIFKYVQVPNKHPEYLHVPPPLNYVETRASELRRDYFGRVKFEEDGPDGPSENDSALQFIEPKMNRSFVLRVKHKKKQPIITDHFDQHFEKFKKPPFNGGLKKSLCYEQR